MNPLLRKAQRFHSLRVQRGLRAAAEATVESLANSVVYRWQRFTSAVPLFRGSERSSAVPPDNDRFDIDSFLPSRQRASGTTTPGSVAVVVPVFRDGKLTRACLESVVTAPSPVVGEIIVIDDASPDPSVRAYLEEFAEDARVRVLRNADNKGFVASSNLGMRAAGRRDVILLNSDTLVSGDWADRLAAHALQSGVATVTPFSNNATICSYPGPRGVAGTPGGESVSFLHEAFRAANLGRSVTLPTGVGFCMFVARAALDELGEFDEAGFGRGYGEENDFCLRAERAGWRNLLAADAFVWHRGEVSFGADARRLQSEGLALLREKYPGYLRSVALHAEKDPARPYRIAATAARYRLDDRPVVLFVLHAHGYGTEKHALELARRYQGAVRFLILRATFEGPVQLQAADPGEALDVRWRMDGDLAPFARLISSFGVRRVHVHHTLGLPLDVHDLIRSLGLPFDFTVHDFFAICPRVRLATPGHKYCGGPEEARCAACLSRRPLTAARSSRQWLEETSWLLTEADRVICPSQDAASHVAPFVTELERLMVVPHEALDHQTFPEPAPPVLAAGDRLRVALLGVLSGDKGAAVVKGCLKSLSSSPDAPEFTLLGFVPDEHVSLIKGTALRATGPYEPSDLHGLVLRTRPHVVWFPAVWPETYSYTLSEAMTERLPVLVPDVGAFAERVAGRHWSWVVPWDLSPEEGTVVFQEVAAQLREGVWKGPNIIPRSGSNVRARAVFPADPGFYDDKYLQPLSLGEGSARGS